MGILESKSEKIYSYFKSTIELYEYDYDRVFESVLEKYGNDIFTLKYELKPHKTKTADVVFYYVSSKIIFVIDGYVKEYQGYCQNTNEQKAKDMAMKRAFSQLLDNFPYSTLEKRLKEISTMKKLIHSYPY